MAKPPHPGSLMAIIRRLAADGASFSQHAFDERMVERGFDLDDVLEIIEQGSP